jgi:putative flavoprotein involved in K+ transport
VEEVKRGRIELVGAVEGFDGADVLLAGGERIQPDVVIAATGYHRGLEPLVGHLGVLGEWGEPVASGAPVPGRPGLWFTGYTVRLSGQLHTAKGESRRIARAIGRSRRVASAAA